MLTGKQLILATKPYARENRRTSWVLLLSTLLCFALALLGTLVFDMLLLRIFSSILMSLLMMRLFIIYHDYQHHTILQKSPLAKVIMTLYGLFMLTPASIWKRSHDYHHNHNSKLFSASIGSYPIATKKKFASMTGWERFSYLAIRHPLVVLSGYLTIFVYGMCISSFVSTPKKHWDSLLALVIHVLLGSLLYVYGGIQALTLTLILPFFLTCAIGAYLFYAQHNFPEVVFNNNEDWTYEKAALLSSSYMKTGKIMQWFSGNIGYHHIHHLNSRIPFYRLPEVYTEIVELQNAKHTSLSLHDIRACFRLKIWDPELQRMISLKEFKQM